MNRTGTRDSKTMMVAVLMVMAALASSARAAMIFSESFESPVATLSGYSVGTGNLMVYGNPNYFSPATDGIQFLVANPANGPSGAVISWNFAVGVGTYTLTFDHRVFGNPTNQKLDVEVTQSSPGDLLSQIMTDNGFGLPSPVVTFNQTFTTTSAGTVTLELTDITPSAPGNATDLIVDNIQVNGPPAPEPASIVLLAIAGPVLLRRRR